MRFNVSRFLVRVRQFWTRERLVPVLGLTALALFLLNFWAFLGLQFNQAPFNGAYLATGNFFSSSSSHWPSHVRHQLEWRRHNQASSRFQNHENDSKRKKCRKKKDRHQSYEDYFETKRLQERARRLHEEAEQYQFEVDRLQEERREEIEQLINERKVEFERIMKEQREASKLILQQGGRDAESKQIHITRDENGNSTVTLKIDGEIIEVP